MNFFLPNTCGVCGGDCPADAAPLCGDCVARFPRPEGPACRRCGVPLRDGGALCGGCRRARPAFRFCRSAGIYDGRLREALLRLKFGGRDALAAPLGAWMADRARTRPELSAADAVVPVPLHFLRRHARGYNQAELLAESFARASGRSLCRNGLARRRWTSPQTRLGRDGRWDNVKGAFAAAPAVAGRHVLLIDDVCTTGATFDACARALREAGARRVSAFAAARQV